MCVYIYIYILFSFNSIMCLGMWNDAAAFPNLMHRPQGETFERQNQKKINSIINAD